MIGFHTNRSVRAFLVTAEEYVGEAFVDHARPRVTLREAVTPDGRAYPISVDPDEFQALAREDAVTEAEARLTLDRPERLVSASIAPYRRPRTSSRGFHAFALFLARHPEWQTGVCRCSRDWTRRGRRYRLCGVRWSDPPCA